MKRNPHISLFVQEETEFAFLSHAHTRRKLEAQGYRVVMRLGYYFAKRRGRLIPLDGFQEKVRATLGKKQRTCTYCQRNFRRFRLAPTIDHRIPLSEGGTWKRNNILLACSRCNDAKSNLSEERFRHLIAEHGIDKIKVMAKRHLRQLRASY